jgi:hypothetical protein
MQSKERVMIALSLRNLFAAGALAAALMQEFSSVQLVGAAPASTLDGLQADAATDPLAQTYMSGVAGTIESIVWWGFHGNNSGGATYDKFIVKLDGNDQARPLDVTTDANGLSRYELDIVDTPLQIGSFELDIVNNSLDVEWFWQYAQGQKGLAYALMGTPAAVVPVPQTLALVQLGLAAMGALGRTRRARS